MIILNIIIESFEIKIDNLNTLFKQYDINDNNNKYLQNECTNLEIKQIELVNKNESLQNKVEFLRNENEKYLVNISSLQK